MSPSKTKAWIQAFRLRTLPLSLSTIGMGSFIAASEDLFNGWVLGLAALTTLFLQVLSNLANDYGDSYHGTDNEDRIGPERAVQSGAISLAQMKTALYICGALAFLSGSSLIIVGLWGLYISYWIGFLILGIASIVAAIKYTAGDNPYGYRGLGDVFVFLFFGIVGVSGTYFLHTHIFNPLVLLPSATLGLLSAGVLNMNNMRDAISDAKSGKNTLVVKMGSGNARWYHLFLVTTAWTSAILFITLWPISLSPWSWLFLLILPLHSIHLIKVLTNEQPVLLDKQLKVLAMSTFLFTVLYGVGLVV